MATLLLLALTLLPPGVVRPQVDAGTECVAVDVAEAAPSIDVALVVEALQLRLPAWPVAAAQPASTLGACWRVVLVSYRTGGDAEFEVLNPAGARLSSFRIAPARRRPADFARTVALVVTAILEPYLLDSGRWRSEDIRRVVASL